MRHLDRRAWFTVAGLALAGCSSATKPAGRKPASAKRSSSKKTEAWTRKNRPKGPQTFGNLLSADAWIADLDSTSPKSRLTAAKQLGNMGSNAKSALPKLEKLTKDPDAQVAAAAKQAIQSIRK
jgi:hypothetical protein